jgi:hypothetical protein
MNTDIQNKIKDGIRLLYRGSLLLLVLFLICGSLYAGFDPLDGMIAENITVGGISIGGMSMEQAYRTLRSASESILEHTELTVEFPEEPCFLSPADTKVSMRCGSAVWDAWKVGRFGKQDSAIALLPYLKLDEAYIRNVISEYAKTHGTEVIATFDTSHIDCTPMGDIVSTVTTLIQGSPDINFLFRHTVSGETVAELDMREVRQILGEDVPPNTPEVIQWIAEYLREQYRNQNNNS